MVQDTDRVSAWLQVLERKVVRDGNALLADTDITVMQFRVLKYLTTHPEESQIADISEFFDVSHPSMVHVVNSLEQKGYVYREPIRRSRGKKIILTESGQMLASENEGRIDRIEDAMMDGFSDEERLQLLAMLKRINANLEQHFGR